MTGFEILTLGALATGVGILIGCVGIGGVLLVPILAYLFNISVHSAIAAAMFAYIFSGIVGTVIYARYDSIQWHTAFFIILGAGPAAFVGAFAISITQGIWLELLIAGLIISAGINVLRKPLDTEENVQLDFQAPTLIGMGTVTGIGSAMTGTGGPLILVPMAVWLRMPALGAIGLSQAVQLPIALLATIGNIMYGDVDWTISSILAGAIVVGTALGARVAHIVPKKQLSKVLACVLVLVGLFIACRLALSLSIL